MRKFKWKHIVALIVAAGFFMMIGIGLDNRLQTTNYQVYDKRVPSAFEGYKLAQLSDIHCQVFGDEQRDLIAAVKAGSPDIILLTGDILDAFILDYDSVEALFDGLTKIAPVYAVSGNHENNAKINRTKMAALYEKYGVRFLKDAGTTIVKDGASIVLFGADDKARIGDSIPVVEEGTYGILLFHRSDLFPQLMDLGYGLVFSGHGHGGLIRIPFVGGIVTTEGTIDFKQKYNGGQFTVGTTTLISNRGMAPSHNIPRIFNRPEVVFVTLHTDD